MPKATAIIYPPRVQADQTNLLMHAALKLKVLINLHLGKRMPNDEDLPESFRVLVRELQDSAQIVITPFVRVEKCQLNKYAHSDSNGPN